LIEVPGLIEVSGLIEVLDTDAALHALAPEWEALWRRLPGRSPFTAPAWLLPWWRHFGTGQPRIATLRHGGRLAAVLPLYVLDESSGDGSSGAGPGGRKLLPIGAGLSDYQDMLAEPGVDPSPLLHAVLARADRLAVCDLIEVPPGSALHGLAPPPGWAMAWGGGSPCPVLALPADVAAMADAVPAAQLRKLRMNRNRADRGGGTMRERAAADTLPALQAELIRLHQARWAAAGEPGVLADPAVLALHQDAAPGLLQAGALRLEVLRAGGAVVAAIMALLSPGRILFYLSGYDAAHAFISPGTLLLGAMLEDAVQEGRTEAHFLRGREAYKYAWGAVDRQNATCRLLPSPSSSGRGPG
jgi:CelD/BcsL family acetyltransferase involved in cellulose biosynthesis